MSIVTHLPVAGLLFLTATASPARGAGPLPFPPRTFELGYQVGYGITHRGFGATRTQVQTVDFIGRVGYFQSGELGRGWYRGEFEHVLEIPLDLAVDPATRSYHHISNASTAEPNEPLNSSKVLVGISVFR
ncbi:acyloxyacyl hydrolase [Geomonas sp. Red32]|uniref:acyloxyacyl hydrolase n=1 Tax=Geomonas sp. Red32 TaxID=2912856 RepID=UPI00202CF68C|nr:acyloxyacyl hydrolase [Geomonas sp. Red32]MCM0083097.1 acyloxyacyl hydrolase [Geomonas sp. Red32]